MCILEETDILTLLWFYSSLSIGTLALLGGVLLVIINIVSHIDRKWL